MALIASVAPMRRASVEAVLVDVADHDVPGADEARDGGGHDADGTGAGDEHVLADDTERERGVSRVAERIEDGARVVVDRIRKLERVGGRNGDVFGETARAIDADADGIATEMPPTGAAVAAVPARDVAFTGHAVAGLDAGHLAADLDDLAAVLVPDDHRHRNRPLSPRIPVEDVEVGAADRRPAHADEDVVVPDRPARDVFHPDAALGACLDECFHRSLPPGSKTGGPQPIARGPTWLSAPWSPRPLGRGMTPSSRPTRANASIACSRCARVCAADICVRILAWPFGHDREREADDVDALVEEAGGHARRQRCVAQHDGDDGCVAGPAVKPSAVMRSRKNRVFSKRRSRSVVSPSTRSSTRSEAAATGGGMLFENRYGRER